MKIVVVTVLLITFWACGTKYNYIDTGISNGVHDCSMLEYLKGDTYNWDTIVRIIERAKLTYLFEGDNENEQITFLGPTNHSIRNWMYDSAYVSVNSIPIEKCKRMVLHHVIKGRYMMTDIPRGSIASSGSFERQGGVEMITLSGNKGWFYTVSSEAYGVPDAGPLTLNCISLDTQKSIPLACPDIQTHTGVVISLDYNFYCGEL